MPALNPTQLGYLRDSHPHKAAINLSVIVPDTVYVGTITGSPDRGDIDITMVDVSGNIANVEEGMTIWVGEDPGGKEITKRRLRARAGQVLTVDEAPVIWQDGWHFTVVNYYELWSKFPYITGVDGAYTFYKDKDVVYTDENEYPPPVAIMGAHQVGNLTGATIVFDLDGSDSYAITPAASISTYLWECSSGIIDNAAVAVTTITFNAAGTYVVKFTITDSNGKSQITRRIIRVHTAADPPYYDFELRASLSGSWSKGGWDTGFTVRGTADQDEFPDGSLVILWADQYYDTTEVSISGDNILFIGYLEGETITKEFDTGSVSFDAYTIQGRMENCNMYSVSLTVVTGSPATWNEYIDNLTVARACHHYWKYHSTLFGVADVYLPTDNTLTMVAQDFEEGSLYSAVDSFTMEHGIFAHVCSDKKSVIRVVGDIQLLSASDRGLATVVMTLADTDRTGEVDVELLRNSQMRTKTVELGGIDHDKNPYLSQAPGIVPEPFGSDTISFNGLVLEDQDHANYLSGRIWGVSNMVIPEIRMPMAGNYSFMDIALQEWYIFSLAAAANKRGIILDAINMVLRDISIDVDVVNGVLSVNVVFEPEADAYDGVTIIPGEYNPPDYPDPPDPDVEWGGLPIPPGIETEGICPVFVIEGDTGVFYNPNALDDTSRWYKMMDGMPEYLHDSVKLIFVDSRFDVDPYVINVYALTSNNVANNTGYRIYRALDVFNRPPRWYLMQELAPYVDANTFFEYYLALSTNALFPDNGMSFTAGLSGTLDTDYPQRMMQSKTRFASLNNGYTHITGQTFAGMVNVTYNEFTDTALTTFSTHDDPYGSGINYVRAWRTINNGASLNAQWSAAIVSDFIKPYHSRANNVIYMYMFSEVYVPVSYINRVYKSIDDGISFSQVYNATAFDIGGTLPQRIGVSDDPNYVMFYIQGSIIRSSNGGSVWTTLSNAGTTFLRKTSISPLHWFMGAAGSLYFTKDFGDNWTALTKEGFDDTAVTISQLETLVRIK